MCDDFTDREIEQQDFVDNEIYYLLRSLAGDKEDKVQWDISIIADIRDVIVDYFEEENIMSEMELYPFRELS